ncbi:MAG: hypothetical protein H0U16_12220 [Actinobacteria bacterium]|nr:hypothetical protein [Actinomycetota bacterium]
MRKDSVKACGVTSSDPTAHPAGIDHQYPAALCYRHAIRLDDGDGPNDDALDLCGQTRAADGARSNPVCFSPQQGVLDGELVEGPVDARELALQLDDVRIALGPARPLLERVERSILSTLADHPQLMRGEPQRRQTSASVVFFRDTSKKICHFCPAVSLCGALALTTILLPGF